MSDQVVLRGSILGSKEGDYTDQEKHWIYRITMALRDREDKYAAVIVREDMEVFSRLGASVYELARKLYTAAQYSRFPATRERSLDVWIRTITGIDFDFMNRTAPTVDTNEICIDIGPEVRSGTLEGVEPAYGQIEGVGESRGLPADTEGSEPSVSDNEGVEGTPSGACEGEGSPQDAGRGAEQVGGEE
jgi:hypothetical protein